ncbi:MFS transporter [Yinghuangia seranimata]|uniref:MFS transporter n=1 Tax=Yinghuangia seranimata TaxID=408067 RepID=UPI00248D10AF|nr:MFS transporter [Yinghuangia seranimata]MDI2130836.1 MFS transporter [Yinghuangia seranimata]
MTVTPPPTRSLRQRLIVPVLAYAGILMALMQTVVVPLLPDLPAETGASPATISWMLTATLVTGAVLNPVLGRAGDMYGKRRVLLASLATMTAGSVLCAVTSDIRLLIAARALQGTAAVVVSLATSIMRDELPPERVGSAAALMSSTVGLGAAFGLPLASIVVEHADWHTMFWVTTGLGVLGLVASWFVVPESPVRTPGRFDLVGTVMLAAGLVALLLAVSKGGEWGWTSPTVPALAGGGVAVLLLWGRHQLHAREPVVDLRLAARRTVFLPHAAALLTGFAFYANWLATAQLVQAPTTTGYGLGESAVTASLCLLPGGVIMVVLSPVSARMSDAYGARVTLALGTAVISAAYLVRVFTSEHLLTIALGASLCSVGTTLAYSALPTLVIQAVPQEQTAAATGLNVLMRTIGQATCSTVVAVVLTRMTTDAGGVRVASLGAYQLVFALASVVAAAASVTALGLPRRVQRESRSRAKRSPGSGSKVSTSTNPRRL